jgi:hypothetical protein
MSEPESSKPADREASPDATVRLSIGKPIDPAPSPDATVRLVAGNPTAPVPDTTVRLVAGNPTAPVPEPTVRLVAASPAEPGPVPEPIVRLIAGSPKEPVPVLEPAPAPDPTVLLFAGKPTDPAFSPDATVRLATGVPTDPVFAPNATVRLSGGRLLDTTPPPEPTVRLGAGAPGDPRSTQQLDISNIISQHQGAGSTLHAPQPEPASSSEDTHKMPRPKLDDPPIRVQKVDQPAEAAGQTQRLPLRAEALRRFGWKLPLALGAGVVIVAAAILVFSRGTTPQTAVVPAPVAPPITAESVPPGAQAYFDKAKAGDVYAMRMLGVMYLNGLNVPQDREKGLYWYRKAAENGSEAARSELSKIEGGH